ncbi:kinase-like domain-containing protein [Phascolomyces articulosus]|uniref:Kinase-like domain-containing protein n=1 Tax=Phascolomyces articulosus TaxID=60185 RepID=A0AAD5KIA9_9FUNG|nr:kinase-like domain-containing protein [Phascolomyces articulosus]
MVHSHTTSFRLGTRINNLEIVNVLGEGAYGQVYLAKQLDSTTPKLYAIKSLRQSKLDDRQRAFQRTEIGLHARLSGHPHIIPLERVIREPEWTHVVLEYGPEGDLFSAITERDLYVGNHALIRHVFLQLLDAVSYCHNNGVYHRDLKPENVLVFDKGRTVKLADFGLATTEPITNDYGCGSTFYFSPECQGDLNRKNGSNQRRVGYATAPNDIWSLGVILINMAAGRNPWRQASLNDDTFCAYLADPNFLLKILPISRELNHILKRIFCIDPLRRIGLDELKERIQKCKYFTRTAQVEQLELQQDLERESLGLHLRLNHPRHGSTHGTKQQKHSVKQKVVLPPSPPATPRSDRSRSSLTTTCSWQQQQQQPRLTTPPSSRTTSNKSKIPSRAATPDEATLSTTFEKGKSEEEKDDLVPTMLALTV